MKARIESTPDRTHSPHEWLSTIALRALAAADVPALIGGAFAFTHYTGIVRHTKDLDLFVRARDVARGLQALEAAGFETSLPFPHWLAKASSESLSMDIIFASGNGLGGVDDEWFQYASDARLYGQPVKLMPAEEMLCSKALIMERERYDGADVAHILHAQGLSLDWPRVLRRMGPNLPVLFSHLWLFLYIYSDGRQRLPEGLLDEVYRLALPRLGSGPDQICRGTLLSREQYLVDVAMRGYGDARLATGAMSEDEIRIWTEAIDAPHE